VTFILIAGTFHLVGQTRTGKPSGFEPDGDSIQFRPDDPAQLDRLERIGSPYRLTSIGSTQLRLEGMDALELHFQGSHQPRPLGDEARDYLTGRCALNPVPYAPPERLRVQPPVPHDGTPGYIAARSLEVYGRPVAFAFAGTPPQPDGSDLFLDQKLVRSSLNYRSVASGHSYPLYYDTLFVDLRATFTAAVKKARKDRAGVWKSDRTATGVKAASHADLEAKGVVFPKLFRRLTSYLDADPSGGVDGFLPWLAKTKEQVLDLGTSNFAHLDDLLAVSGSKVRLTVPPEQLVFVSAKTTSRAVAPWLRV
jgi:endonuclease YncB( thermonuclease family)